MASTPKSPELTLPQTLLKRYQARVGSSLSSSLAFSLSRLLLPLTRLSYSLKELFFKTTP
ncbi:MAG: hypothetical protein LBF22_06820 [Deltaproteobacteria bacterium]|nr:hypothetical protein [Deltaproteobacteria bacterium]